MNYKDFYNHKKEIEGLNFKYKIEVEEKYGNSSAFKESQKKTNKYSKDDWNLIMSNQTELFSMFAYQMNDFKSIEAQKLVREWKDFITNHYYTCTDDILRGLGELYVSDRRFVENIDKTKPGLAKFISDSINYYCNNL
ncbi:TipAS antibiotic-recognition domain-containing protein [Mycoplasmatota bacterium WC44]